MRYRKLDANNDMTFGHGHKDFYFNEPEAPAQAVLTRLCLWLGEWFLDVTDGTPYMTEVLGKYTGSTRDPALRNRILGTTGISAIVSYASQVNRDTRAFDVQAQLDTIYGGAFVGLLESMSPSEATIAGPRLLTPLRTQSGAPLVTQSGDVIQAQRG